MYIFILTSYQETEAVRFFLAVGGRVQRTCSQDRKEQDKGPHGVKRRAHPHSLLSRKQADRCLVMR